MSRGKCSDTIQLGASTISLIRRLAAVLHNRYASAGSSPRFVASHSIMYRVAVRALSSRFADNLWQIYTKLFNVEGPAAAGADQAEK